MSAAIGVLVAALLALVGAWFAGKSKGRSDESVKAAEQRTKDNEAIAAEIVSKNQSAVVEQTKATVEANEIDEAVSRMSDDDVFNELRNGSRTAENHNDGDKK